MPELAASALPTSSSRPATDPCVALELVPASPVTRTAPPAHWVRTMRRGASAAFRPRSMRGVAITGALAFALVVAGMPLLAPWLLALGAAHYLLVIALYTFSDAYTQRVHGPFGL